MQILIKYHIQGGFVFTRCFENESKKEKVKFGE